MMENLNLDFRAVIKFLTTDGANARDIYRSMADVYDDNSPQYFTVAKWSAEFKRGRSSLEDTPQTGRPADAVTKDMINRVETLIMNDRRIKVDELARECDISHGSVCTIIHEHVGKSKVSARWVPRNLTPKVVVQPELLEIYNENLRLVTGDETWIHHWDPDTKKNLCNGSILVHPRQRNSAPNHLLAKSWPLYFGIPRVCC